MTIFCTIATLFLQMSRILAIVILYHTIMTLNLTMWLFYFILCYFSINISCKSNFISRSVTINLPKQLSFNWLNISHSWPFFTNSSFISHKIIKSRGATLFKVITLYLNNANVTLCGKLSEEIFLSLWCCGDTRSSVRLAADECITQ